MLWSIYLYSFNDTCSTISEILETHSACILDFYVKVNSNSNIKLRVTSPASLSSTSAYSAASHCCIFTLSRIVLSHSQLARKVLIRLYYVWTNFETPSSLSSCANVRSRMSPLYIMYLTKRLNKPFRRLTARVFPFWTNWRNRGFAKRRILDGLYGYRRDFFCDRSAASDNSQNAIYVNVSATFYLIFESSCSRIEHVSR